MTLAFTFLSAASLILAGAAGYDLRGWLQTRRARAQEARQRQERRAELRASIQAKKATHGRYSPDLAELQRLTHEELAA